MRYTFRGESGHIIVDVTEPAERLIGPKTIPDFVKRLTELMEAYGAETAYVYKCGQTIAISIISQRWGQAKMEIGRS